MAHSSPSPALRGRAGRGKLSLDLTRRLESPRRRGPLPNPPPQAGEGAQAPRFGERRSQFVLAVMAFFTTMPPFITNFTRSISERSVTGFPDTAMMSANLPFSMLPMWFSQS
jgi:hypothetical protein